MELLVLIGQRKERYEGEYALEALAVIDDVGDNDNPDYMHKQFQEQHTTGDFDALAVVRLEVSEKAIREVLYPSLKVLPAAVIPPNAKFQRL